MQTEFAIDEPGMRKHMETGFWQKADDLIRLVFNTGMSAEDATKPAVFLMPEFKFRFGAVQEMNFYA